MAGKGTMSGLGSGLEIGGDLFGLYRNIQILQNGGKLQGAFAGAKSVAQLLDLYQKSGGVIPPDLAHYLGPAGSALGVAGGIATAFDPNAPTGRRVLGGLEAGAGAAELLGHAIPYAGPALSLAGLGLGLSDIAGDENLSTKQKVGHGVDTAVSTFVPYYALSRLANSIVGPGGVMQRSGSPIARETGKTIAAPAAPVEALLDVFKGDRSPRAAANAASRAIRETGWGGKLLSLPIGGPFLGAFGIGNLPTAGTQYRMGLQGAFRKLGLPEFDRADRKLYNMPLEEYNAFSPETRKAAEEMGNALSGKRPKYAGQTANILLHTLGDDVVNQWGRLQQAQHQAQTQAQQVADDRPRLIAASGPMAQAQAKMGTTPGKAFSGAFKKAAEAPMRKGDSGSEMGMMLAGAHSGRATDMLQTRLGPGLATMAERLRHRLNG